MLGSGTTSTKASNAVQGPSNTSPPAPQFQLSTKTGQPSAASPRTAETNRRRLGGLLSAFGFGGSPLRRGTGFVHSGDVAERLDDGASSSRGTDRAPLYGQVRSFADRLAELELGEVNLRVKGTTENGRIDAGASAGAGCRVPLSKVDAASYMEQPCSIYRLPDELYVASFQSS